MISETEPTFGFLTPNSRENDHEESDENTSRPRKETEAETEAETEEITQSESEPAPDTLASLRSRLDEERGWRTRLQQELREAKAQMNETLLALRQGETPGKASVSTPDPEEDPVGFLAHELANLRAEMKTLKGEREQTQQKAQMGEQEAALLDVMRDSIQSATAKRPELTEAIGFLSRAREAELATMGYSPSQIRQAIKMDLLTLSAQAVQNEQDPAQMLFDIARARGFQTKEKTQKAPPTLGGLRGIPKQKISGNIDPLELSDTDFDKLWAQMNGKS